MKNAFKLKYDGPAIVDHEMDLELLSPALLGLSKLVQKIVKHESGQEFTAKLKIKGNPEQGSIELLFTYDYSTLISMAGMFSSEVKGHLDVSDILTKLAELATLATFIGLQPFVSKRIGADKVNIEVKNNNVTINQTFNHNTFNIYNNDGVRESLYETLKPLEEPGITSASFKRASGEFEFEVTEDQVGKLVPIYHKEVLSDNTATKILIIETPHFGSRDLLWRFDDGSDSTLKAYMADEHFWNLIENGFSFAKGAWIKAEIQTLQFKEAGSIKTTTTIVKVLDANVTKPEQFDLNIPNKDRDDRQSD